MFGRLGNKLYLCNVEQKKEPARPELPSLTGEGPGEGPPGGEFRKGDSGGSDL